MYSPQQAAADAMNVNVTIANATNPMASRAYGSPTAARNVAVAYSGRDDNGHYDSIVQRPVPPQQAFFGSVHPAGRAYAPQVYGAPVSGYAPNPYSQMHASGMQYGRVPQQQPARMTPRPMQPMPFQQNPAQYQQPQGRFSPASHFFPTSTVQAAAPASMPSMYGAPPTPSMYATSNSAYGGYYAQRPQGGHSTPWVTVQ